MTVIGAVVGGLAANEQTDSTKRQIDAQKRAEAASLAAQKENAQANFDYQKGQAEIQAADMERSAARLLTTSSQAKTFAEAQLGQNLGSAAQSSRQATSDLGTLNEQAIRSTATVTAGLARSGVKLTGSAAEVKREQGDAATRALGEAQGKIDANLRNVQSGTTIAKEQIGAAFADSMFNRDVMISDAARARAAFEEGGSAYTLFQANKDYASTVSQIRQDYFNSQKAEAESMRGWSIATGVVQGMSAGLGIDTSIARIAFGF